MVVSDMDYLATSMGEKKEGKQGGDLLQVADANTVITVELLQQLRAKAGSRGLREY